MASGTGKSLTTVATGSVVSPCRLYYGRQFGIGTRNKNRRRWLAGPKWLEKWKHQKYSRVKQDDEVTNSDSSRRQDKEADDDASVVEKPNLREREFLTPSSTSDSDSSSDGSSSDDSSSNDSFSPESLSTPYPCDVNPSRKRKSYPGSSALPTHGQSKRVKLVDDEEFELYGKLISSKLRSISKQNRMSCLQLQAKINTLLFNEEVKVLNK